NIVVSRLSGFATTSVWLQIWSLSTPHGIFAALAMTKRGVRGFVTGSGPTVQAYAFPRWADDDRTAHRHLAAHPLSQAPSDEKRRDSRPDFRILPPVRHGGIDLRTPRGQ